MNNKTDSEAIENLNQDLSKSPSKDIMYLGLGTAMPKETNVNYKAGLNHALLVFAQAKDFDTANTLAKEHLSATGWQDLIIDKLNPVDINALGKAPEEVMAAYETALVDGSHAMILESPNL